MINTSLKFIELHILNKSDIYGLIPLFIYFNNNEDKIHRLNLNNISKFCLFIINEMEPFEQISLKCDEIIYFIEKIHLKKNRDMYLTTIRDDYNSNLILILILKKQDEKVAKLLLDKIAKKILFYFNNNLFQLIEYEIKKRELPLKNEEINNTTYIKNKIKIIIIEIINKYFEKILEYSINI